jgi:hypothetical protein
MPKPFIVGIEIEEIALGSVMRRLHAMEGIVSIHLDFEKKPNGEARPRARPRSDGQAEASKPREDSKAFEETGYDAVLRILKGKPKSLGEIRDAFSALGRSPSSVNSLVYHLQKDKKAFRIAPNLYSRRKPK